MESSLSRELPFSQATVSFIGDQIDQGTKKNRNLTPAPRFQLRQLKVSDVAEPVSPPGLGDICEAFSACVIGAMSNPASHNQTPKPARVRRTRFVCISDTHNHELKLPKGDVLIHAGDLTNQGTFSEVGFIIDKAAGSIVWTR